MLSEPQIQRYSRQILLREVGGAGQARLLGSAVRIPRLTTGGRACALWLARAGVGTLVFADDPAPSPAIDAAGLLWAGDAGRPLGEAVRDRLRFHEPNLVFAEGEARLEAAPADSPAEGALAALAVVRQILLELPQP